MENIRKYYLKSGTTPEKEIEVLDEHNRIIAVIHPFKSERGDVIISESVYNQQIADNQAAQEQYEADILAQNKIDRDAHFLSQASAKAKLEALGFTEDEILALIGY